MSTHVVIYDDERRRVNRWVRHLEDVVSAGDEISVAGLEEEQFLEELAELQRRRAVARRTGGEVAEELLGLELDRTDVLVIDFDLFRTYPDAAITGETVSYLARCYSACGVIVGLNQFGNRVFDLRLPTHSNSFADLNIGDKDLINPGLWGAPWRGYRPWSWPLLPRFISQFKKRIRELRDALDTPITEFFQIPEQVLTTLPTAAREYLSANTDVRRVTFRQFVDESENALRPKDKPYGEEAIKRIAAARVSRWIADFLLHDQHLLVDAPHLVERFPSLLKGDVEARESWNATASFEGVSKLGVRHEKLRDFRFLADAWLDRVAWYWKPLSESEAIAEVSDPWSTVTSEYVFCEDISQFLPTEQAESFLADSASPYARRHIVNRRKVRDKPLAADLRGVEFQNQSRLAL